MTKTERAVDATAAAVRSVAAGAAESRRARASRYATVAKMAAAAAGIGGAAEAVDAAIVSGSIPVAITTPGLGPTLFFSQVGIGDSVLANAFAAGLFQGATITNGTISARYGGILVNPVNVGTGVHANLLPASAVVGVGMTFSGPIANVSSGPAGGSVAAATGVPVVIGSSNSVRGYVGFRFDNGGTDNFGYFDVEWSRTGVGQGSTLTVTIHGWAYDNSGAAITIGGATPIPGGTGLAALAIGAVGLRGRRRSRN